jgi:hypothetical protein
MLIRLPIDLIVEIGILAGPDEYEQIAKTSKRNAIILQNPYIIRATNEILVKVTTVERLIMTYHGNSHSFNDQPAIITSDGCKYWCQHGNLHRDNDRPAIIRSNGNCDWYQHGKLHRDNDQPAYIAYGRKEWYQRGKLHRDNDQPAIITSDGRKQWYQYGIWYQYGN